MIHVPRLRFLCSAFCLLFCLLFHALGGSPGWAESGSPAPEPEPAATPPATAEGVPPVPADASGLDRVEALEEETSRLIKLWKSYTKHMDGVLENVIALDLWGISTPQLPKGILKIKYNAEHQKVNQRYNTTGGKDPFAPSLEFPNVFHDLLPDVFTSNDDIFFVDLQGPDGGGEGFGHTIQMSYGITDALDFYVELPFQRAEVLFDVTYKPGNLSPEEWDIINDVLSGINFISGGPPIDLRTVDGFWNFIEALGRPRLVEHYKSDGWDLGDIHAGFSWNYYKGRHFAAATTCRVYFPTGWQPAPNNSIELFTGAGFPAGTAAWGVSTTQGYDLRLPDPLEWVIFNLEFTYEYRFRTRRAAPTFPKRAPVWEEIYQLLASEEPDIAMLFPDLSDMGNFWHITYGHSFDGEIGLTLNPFKIIPFGVKYAGGWSMEPIIESSSEEFIQYVENVEIVGEQAKQMIAFGTAISLIPFYIPLNITFQYRIPLWGYGAFVVEENWAITGEFFLAF